MRRLKAYLIGKLAVKYHYDGLFDLYSLCSVHEPELYLRGQRKQKIPTSLRWEVWRRDHFLCFYCGAYGQNLSLDHVIPEMNGGKAEAGNLVTSCSSCNRKKASLSFEEFVNSKWLKRKRDHIAREKNNARHSS